MAVNKVVINDAVVLDLTGDTVTPSDLVEGVTAHDATGMQITGTRPATSGTDTSDATATASDIARDKTAYVQGKKVTGKLYETAKGKTKTYFTWGSEYVTLKRDDNRELINIKMPWIGNDEIMRVGSYIELGADVTLFGNATAADVAKGKTMTSAAGLMVVGTNTNDADTSDADATAADIAKGKTAYVQGKKVTGELQEYLAGETLRYSTSGSKNVTFNRGSDSDRVSIKIHCFGEENIMRSNSYIELGADAILFGNATAADVAKGKTMTSAAGLMVVGTNTNDADTSDADATAADIAKGKTAYVQGKKVTGELQEYLAGETLRYSTSGSKNVTFNRGSDSDRVSIKIHCFGEENIMRSNSYIELGADAILFGDATAADVAKGKTFTSAAGVNVTGTAEPAESNNNVEAYAVTDTSPSVSFRRTDGTIKIWGYGTMTSSGGWGQQTTSLVAFEGDKYHKGAIYGSPSSTSLSLSISNGKLTGLPSGLTAISAIVTRGI